MIERTLVLIKPDAVLRGFVGEIIHRFERTGLKYIGMKMVYADKELAGKHYKDDEEWYKAVGEKAIRSAEKGGIKLTDSPRDIGVRVRSFLIEYVTMAPMIALAIEGHRAVEVVRKLVGTTNPIESPPGTIRGDFTIDSYDLADASKRPIQNIIHASDSKENGEEEVKLWFKPEELHVWKRVSEDLIYRNFQNKEK